LVYGRGLRIFRGPGAEGESPVERFLPSAATAIADPERGGYRLRSRLRDADPIKARGDHIA
jgi:hypothetical protein